MATTVAVATGGLRETQQAVAGAIFLGLLIGDRCGLEDAGGLTRAQEERIPVLCSAQRRNHRLRSCRGATRRRHACGSQGYNAFKVQKDLA
ncbi:hypothetical protein U1Q18_015629 [Sarracenia purpurea var. burkii]